MSCDLFMRTHHYILLQEWRQLLQSPCLWARLNLRGCQNPEPALRHLEGSESALASLRAVDLEFAVGMQDRHLVLLQRCAQLEDVNLNSCQQCAPVPLPQGHVRVLSGSQDACHAMNDTQLRQCHAHACRVTDRGVAGLVRASPALKRLSLYWNLNIGLDTLTALAHSCPGLERINLSGCKGVTDLGIERLAAGCTQLTHVDLTRYGRELWACKVV